MNKIQEQLKIVNEDEFLIRHDSRFTFDFEDYPFREKQTFGRMCALLGVDTPTGQDKRSLLSSLRLFCKYSKVVVDRKVYYTISSLKEEGGKIKIDLKGVKPRQFKVTKEDESKHGIYAIIKGKGIYIGATYKDSFREEFISLAQNPNRHWDSHHKGYGLTLGGDFIILESVEDNLASFKYEGTNEMLKRIKKNVSVNTEYVIMNGGRGIYSNSFNNLKVPVSNYKKCMDLLIENELI